MKFFAKKASKKQSVDDGLGDTSPPVFVSEQQQQQQQQQPQPQPQPQSQQPQPQSQQPRSRNSSRNQSPTKSPTKIPPTPAAPPKSSTFPLSSAASASASVSASASAATSAPVGAPSPSRSPTRKTYRASGGTLLSRQGSGLKEPAQVQQQQQQQQTQQQQQQQQQQIPPQGIPPQQSHSSPLSSPQPRPSRSHPRQASASSSLRRKKVGQVDADTHPLNLPPEQRKRLSALSAMSGRNSMDVDKDPVAGAASVSTAAPVTAATAAPAATAAVAAAAAVPSPTMPTLSKQSSQSKPSSQPKQSSQPTSPAVFQSNNPFTVPVANGANGTSEINDAKQEEAVPAPPPHRTSPTSPRQLAAQDAEIFKNEGNRYFKERNYPRAIEYYTKAIVLQPESATYLGNRAAALMGNNRYYEALEDCKRATELDPPNPKILLRLARIHTGLGQPEEALATFSRIHPPPSAKDTAQAREMLQYIQAAKRALDEGAAGSMVLHPLEMAERYLASVAPKPRKWQLMRGAALLKMGNENSLGEAQNIATSLLRLNNQDAEAMVLGSRALHGQGDSEKAVKLLTIAVEGDPDNREAVYWLRTVRKLERMKEDGNADFKAGRYERAVEKYTQALDVDPMNKLTNAKIFQNRAVCRIKMKQFDLAAEDCDQALALNPGYTKARKTKANALGQAGRWDACVKEWKAIQELEPEDRTVAKEVRNAELELKKSQRKDYYKILDIPKTADENAIKKAYRRQAIKYHPDKNPGDENAEARFKDISEAYETLSDEQKRARYDNGEDLMDPSDMFGGGGMGGGIDPEILFSMMGQQAGGFPGGPSYSFGGSGSRSRPQAYPSGFNFQ